VAFFSFIFQVAVVLVCNLHFVSAILTKLILMPTLIINFEITFIADNA